MDYNNNYYNVNVVIKSATVVQYTGMDHGRIHGGRWRRSKADGSETWRHADKLCGKETDVPRSEGLLIDPYPVETVV